MMYLKTMKPTGELSTVIKITEAGVLYVNQKSIERDERVLDSIDSEYEWYVDTLSAKESTKKEFDEFYIETVKHINELSNI